VQRRNDIHHLRAKQKGKRFALMPARPMRYADAQGYNAATTQCAGAKEMRVRAKRCVRAVRRMRRRACGKHDSKSIFIIRCARTSHRVARVANVCVPMPPVAQPAPACDAGSAIGACVCVRGKEVRARVREKRQRANGSAQNRAVRGVHACVPRSMLRQRTSAARIVRRCVCVKCSDAREAYVAVTNAM